MTTHADLTQLLDGLEVAVGASDLHGSLTGLISARAAPPAGDWLGRLAFEDLADALARGADRAPFDALLAETGAALDDPDCGFEPLLPEADAPLAARSAALVEWCRGFLGGLGLAGAGADLERRLSAAGREMLGDLARIGAARFDDDDGEEAEAAYAEIVEYVRVGVLLLRDELREAAHPPTRH